MADDHARMIFEACLELPQEGRAPFIEEACRGDAELASYIERLLAAHLRAENDPRFADAAVPAELADPKVIGPYRILERIGEGGMGVVYVAEQTRPLRRRVALKIIKLGMDTKQVIARFDSERQALALMSHSSIARILDAGATEQGRPYFVMEYVPGVPIHQYCDTSCLDVHERLVLFVQVCRAVEHAHQKGVIHRDIKPGNILVTEEQGQAVPKVIDFGVAKATSQRLTEHTVYTEIGVVIGTPEYMSPEQAALSPLEMDLRTDVYSLGVVLYQVLVGTLPFDFSQKRRVFGEIQRQIQEVEPDPPSARLLKLPESDAADVAQKRSDSVPALAKKLRGELDLVVMKALAKDRRRRYATAAEFAAELDRVLKGEPVHARPASPLYRLGMFARRQRVGLIIGAGIVAVMSAVWIARQSARQLLPLPTVARTAAHTFDPEIELNPAISPDGRQIAYTSGPIGRQEVRVLPVGGAPSPIAAEGLRAFHLEIDEALGPEPGPSSPGPRWSPDGQRLLVVRGDRLYEIPASGGTPRAQPLPEDALDVTEAIWSPDGNAIAYVASDRLRVHTLESGEDVTLTETIGPYSLSWSPRGTWIAYVTGNLESLFNVGPTTIWIVRPEGGDPIPVTTNEHFHLSPDWLPDERLLFVSNRDGPRDIYALQLAGQGLPLHEPARLTTGLDAYGISVSRDAQTVAYSLLTRRQNIWSIEIPRDAPVSGYEGERVTTGNQTIEGLAVSPDGVWIAFDSDRSGNQDVYKQRLASGSAIRLTSDPADEFVRSWSPDGRWIAGHGFNAGNRDLFLADTNGVTTQLITQHPAHDYHPVWSPDMQRIAFSSDRVVSNGEPNLFIVERDENGNWKTPRQVTHDGGLGGMWSPDGALIAYQSRGRVWVTSPDGGDPHAITSVPSDSAPTRVTSIQWSPDGRSIIYRKIHPDLSFSLCEVSLDGDTRELVRFEEPGRPPSYPFAVSDNRIFYTMPELDSDIWVMHLSLQ